MEQLALKYQEKLKQTGGCCEIQVSGKYCRNKNPKYYMESGKLLCIKHYNKLESTDEFKQSVSEFRKDLNAKGVSIGEVSKPVKRTRISAPVKKSIPVVEPAPDNSVEVINNSNEKPVEVVLVKPKKVRGPKKTQK